MIVDLLRRPRRPAIIHYMGVDIYTQDAIVIDPKLDPFTIDSNAYGPLRRRMNGRTLEVSFTPVGVWTAAQIAVLYPFLNFKFGQYNTPIRNVEAVTTASNSVTITAHRILAGTGVRVGKGTLGTTMPSGLSVATTYYVSVPDANTLKFHATEAAALAGTSPVAITTTGSGKIVLIQNSPMIVQFLDGDRFILQNAGCTQMPGLIASTVKTMMKQAKFEGYGLQGTDWSDDNSLYKLETVSFSATPPDPADIPTVPFTLDWGTLVGIDSREGIDIDFPMKLNAVESDAQGLLCQSLQEVSVQAQFIPTNLAMEDLLSQLGIQGGTAARGQDMPTADLKIYGPGNNPYIEIYGASLTAAPLRAGTNDDLVDKLTFASTRTFSGGAPDPVAFLGLDEPV